MTVTYEIDADELNENFLESLRSLFKGRRLKLTVEEPSDLSEITKTKVQNALQSKEVLSFSIQEFESIAARMNADEEIDIEEFKTFHP